VNRCIFKTVVGIGYCNPFAVTEFVAIGSVSDFFCGTDHINADLCQSAHAESLDLVSMLFHMHILEQRTMCGEQANSVEMKHK
jgi:hypothetical protein